MATTSSTDARAAAEMISAAVTLEGLTPAHALTAARGLWLMLDKLGSSVSCEARGLTRQVLRELERAAETAAR